MKLYNKLIFLITLTILSFNVMACSEYLDIFLKSPTAENHMKYVSKLEKSTKEDKYKVCGIPFNNYDFEKILNLVDEKNIYAFDIAFRSLSYYGSGGDYEDILRSLGSFSEYNPELFFKYVKNYNVSYRRLNSLLTMLPLSTVDDFELKIRVLDKRITAIDKLKNKEFSELKKNSITILTEFRDRLRGYLEEYKSSN